jgi:chemotaxis signal transduction protein
MNTATQVVAPRMQALQKLEKSLKRLDLSWKVIETTARVVSPPESVGFIATLEHTRAAFSRLATEMVEQIAQTHRANCQHDLAARAQVAIDILVRNLFERTADVGFIATDAPLVSFVQAPTNRAGDRLHARLTEYRNKYTVYDDILVLDASAQILLALQPRAEQVTQAPAWWDQALANSGYIEAYGASSLFPGLAPVLLYAHCIRSPQGSVCGVVVLKFDLPSELRSIFQALQRAHTSILLLDARARVVASSDPGFAPLETLDLPGPAQAAEQILRHRGVDYVFAHGPTRGYQGYAGPGWTALALVRLDQAFEVASPADTPEAGQAPAGAIEIELNNPDLLQIIARARAIEEDLNRVIWNGKLLESGSATGSALGPVFAEIGRTSQQTIAAFDGAILELKNLLLLGRRAELAAHALLAVDIMDRNLYERANDCRWWALSEEFADLLQTLEAGPSEVALQRAGEILAHLNSLYTVYRRVALFDRQGRILAVSRDPQTLATGASIPVALLQSTLALQSSQAYTVSAMLPHALADGAATYLYCAPIRQATDQRPLGGIALAFNCHDELQAMLQDSLPLGAAAIGLLVDREGRVLSSTHAELAVGTVPEFLDALQGLATDAAAAPLCQWQGRSYLLGQAQSKGYREFKTTDGYRDDVRSVLLTAVDPSPQAPPHVVLPQPRLGSGNAATHFGVVQCGRMLFALDSTQVVEAVSAAQLGAPVAASDAVGLLKYSLGGEVLVLPVFDSCKLTGQAPIVDPAGAAVIVLRGEGGRKLALLVNRLVDVIVCDQLEAPPGGINPQAPWISGYIHDSQSGTEPVFALDAQRLLQTPQPSNVMPALAEPA